MMKSINLVDWFVIWHTIELRFERKLKEFRPLPKIIIFLCLLNLKKNNILIIIYNMCMCFRLIIFHPVFPICMKYYNNKITCSKL